jgi:hypothetical protein
MNHTNFYFVLEQSIKTFGSAFKKKKLLFVVYFEMIFGSHFFHIRKCPLVLEIKSPLN